MNNSIKKCILYTFFAFTALYFVMESALHAAFSYMFESLAIAEQWEKLDRMANILLYSKFLSVAAGMAVWALIPQRLISEKARGISFRASAGAAAIFSALAYFLSGTPSYICVIGIVLSSASALGLLLWRLPEVLPSKRIGIFLGGGLALPGAISFFLFSSPFWDERLPFAAFMALLGVSAAFVSTFGLPSKLAFKAESIKKSPALSVSPLIIVVFIAILVLSTTITDIMSEHLFYFHEVFAMFPNFGYILYALALVMCVFSGFLFDKKIGVFGFLSGFLLMGFSQAMALFFKIPVMGVPYYVFNHLGAELFLVFSIAFPIYYAAFTKSGERGFPPQLGLICRNLFGFAVMLIFPILQTQTYDPDTFNYTLGGMLLLTLAGTALCFIYFIAGEKSKRRELEGRIKENGAWAEASFEEKISGFGFTARETEVLRLLLDGEDTADIAGKLVVTEKTVQNYVSSLLSKTGVKSRLKLVTMFITKPAE